MGILQHYTMTTPFHSWAAIVKEKNTIDTKENLPSSWPLESNSIILTVPKHVNERARDWIERALARWWPEWEKLTTVEQLKAAFIDAFVPFVLENSDFQKTICSIDGWNLTLSSTKFSNVQKYNHLTQWVKDMERDKLNPPYWNTLWVACKNITFENCVWAMNVEANTFRAIDKFCPKTEIHISGFLQRDRNTIIWLADFTKYISYKHYPKPKCKQAIARKLLREETKFDLMLLDDF